MRLSSRPLFTRALAWVPAVWLVHAILRLAVLARPDAFGHPFVGKIHWYLFHAWSFDAVSIFLGSIPFLAHVWFWENRSPRWAKTGYWALAIGQAAMLPLAVADHELQRFMGSRLTFSLVGTYGNPASMKEVFRAMLDDRGGPGVPFVLLLGCVPLAIFLARRLARLPTLSTKPWRWVIGCFAFALVGWVYTQFVWGGFNREQKLRPVIQVWIDEITETVRPGMSQAAWNAGARRWRETWLSESGSDTGWTFPDSTRPFWRVPRTESVAAPQDRRNVVLIVMESGRGLNCGFLKPYGAVRDATPFLDSMAQTGKVWARHTCPSMPTVRALMAMHLGVPDHPDKNIATSFPALHHKAFTQILRDEGWQTRFFSGADPAWDNETPWLGRWYDGFDYSQSREQDEDLFAHVGEWMHGNVSVQTPFLVTVMTKSNHYPFDQKPEWQDEPDLQKRHERSMRYMDSCIGVFVGGLQKEPWFSKTTFVVTGDHGFPLGEHGPGNMGFGLFDESTWVALLAWGDTARLAPGVEMGPTSHLDIPPTILALAGLRKANHFAGHDLLHPVSPSRRTWATHYDELSVQTATWRAHSTISGQPREHGSQLFRYDLDPRELADSLSGRQLLFDSLVKDARARANLAVEALRRDALVGATPP